jgi:TonB family protein
MINAVSVVVIALSLWNFALSSYQNARVPNNQTNTQAPDQAEAARLNAAVFDLFKQGKYDEAIAPATRVLEIARRSGPDRPAVAAALANLAEIYLAKKKDGDSENLFQQAAAIYEKNQIKSPALSDVLERLAQSSFIKRKYDRATMFLDRSLAIRERSYGAESSQVAETLLELANVYQVVHQYVKAEPLYLRSILIREKLLGRTDPNTVQAMKDFACLRVRTMPAGLNKKEIETDLTEAEKEQHGIIERASCWLYGFKQDCDQVSYSPQQKGSSVLNGKAVKLSQPPYPSGARSQRLSGTVFVAVLIDEDGNVIKAKALCGGYPELNGAGVTAARTSKFSPTKVDDRPIQVTGMIMYRFIAQ